MERLTRHEPENNTQAMLNFARAVDGRVKLGYASGRENADLCEYIADQAADAGYSCAPTPDEVMEGSCMECDCVFGILSNVATQAAELHARLMKIEDILGDTYNLEEMRCALAWYKDRIEYVKPTVFHTPGSIPTVYGYNVDHLAMVAEMLKKQLIFPDKMKQVFDDFKAMYGIICQEHRAEVEDRLGMCAYNIIYPSAAEVAARVLPPVRHNLLMGEWKERLWNDLREHSGLVED